MADGLGCGVNSVVGAWHHLRALQVSFDRTKREAQLPQTEHLFFLLGFDEWHLV